MTQKQQAFILEYLASGNATQSAIKAGYSKKTARVIGQENLLKPALKSYIEEFNQKNRTEKIISITERKELLTKMILDEEQQAGVRLRALDLLNKMESIYTQHIHTTVQTEQINPFSSLTVEELRHLAYGEQ